MIFLLCAPPLTELQTRVAQGERWSTLPFGLLVSCVAAAALAFLGLWLAVVVVATTVEALTGASWALLHALTPAVLRRLVLVCCGLTVGGVGALSPAAADPPAGTEEHAGAVVPSTRSVLVGLPLPDRAIGGAAGTAEPGAAPRRRVHRGDSLWAIAEELLPPSAGAAEIGTVWRRIYRANRAAIGPDPDLLIPGTTLRLPDATGRQATNKPRQAQRPDTTPRKDAS